MSQIETNIKPAESFTYLKYCGNDQNYKTRAKFKRLRDIPNINASAYRTHSTKYSCIKSWNNLLRTNSEITFNKT